MTLEEFNALSERDVHDALALCCVSERWIASVAAGRPYADRGTLLTFSDTVWSQSLEPDLLQAFEGHPKIGDVQSLRKRYASSAALAAGEQSAVSDADGALLERLAAGNRAYEDKFGFIFIVCATGRGAAEICEMLEARLANDRATELAIAGAEQGAILRLRMEKLL